MAQKVQVILVDDLDGGDAEESVSFSLDGVSYEIDLSAENAEALREAAVASGAAIPGYMLAGKTGTAEKADPETGGYSKTKYVASFVGFAPARDPKLLTLVMVDEPQGDIYGGSVAAPAWRDIMSFSLNYLRIPPK